MPQLSPQGPDVSPSFTAGFLLHASNLLSEHDLPHPTGVAIARAFGVSRTHMYVTRDRLAEELPGLARGPGRPPKEPDPDDALPDTAELADDVLDYVYRHPGCVHRSAHRTAYSTGFRLHVLDLWEAHPDVPRDAFARATQVPAGTLKDWLAGGQQEVNSAATRERKNLATRSEEVNHRRLQAVLAAWASWDADGRFVAFCDHVRDHLRIPYGRTLIRNLLEAEGVRIPKRRTGRSPDELATRDRIEKFFPDAQWTGDGMSVPITVAGQRFAVNLEFLVDMCSAAITGVSVRDEEDGQAVVEAFEDGKATTGTAPIAVLLDNRSSNHTDEVDEGLGDTLTIRATKGRPQTKGHVEGAFGNFSQTAPELQVDSLDPRDLARCVVELVARTHVRTQNHRPMKKHEGKSRVELHREAAPTDEERKRARQKLQERVRKQDKAHETRKARMDPIVRTLLAEAFDTLDLLDPDEHIRASIARYPVDHVVNGIAIFKAKRAAGTLPDDAGGRYLLGIVRNLSQEDEGFRIAMELLQERLAVRDRALVELERRHDTLDAEAGSTLKFVASLTDEAMATRRRIDRLYWLKSLADAIHGEAADQHEALYRVAARRISAHHRVPHRERLRACRYLAVLVVPVA